MDAAEVRRGRCFGGYLRRDVARRERMAKEADLRHRRHVLDLRETRVILARLYREKSAHQARLGLEAAAARI
jgi:hypothetical protein